MYYAFVWGAERLVGVGVSKEPPYSRKSEKRFSDRGCSTFFQATERLGRGLGGPVRWKVSAFLGGLIGVALFVFLLWPWLKPGVAQRTITLYGFSILSDAIHGGVFPAFAEQWERDHGEKVELISAFAGSGTVTNQIRLGVPAQVAILSLELDALALQNAGVLEGPTWRELPYEGVLNQTPFVILVREGNPKEIEDFHSLTRDGVGVVHPDPLTSGGAQWAILAEYGSVVRSGGTAEQAQEQLNGIWKNVLPKPHRRARPAPSLKADLATL